MKILSVRYYKDGGTIALHTKNEVYCINKRIDEVEYKGRVYLGYPLNDNSNLINDDILEQKILKLYEKETKIC